MERTRFSRCPAPLKEIYVDVVELKCFRKLVHVVNVVNRDVKEIQAQTILKRLQVFESIDLVYCIRLSILIIHEIILLEIYCINFFLLILISRSNGNVIKIH